MQPLHKSIIFLILLLQAATFCKGQSAPFTFQTTNGTYCEPTVVNFTQAATGSPSGYSWSFGNGTFSNAANPSTTYTIAGTYTVTLTAIYANTTAQSSQTITINPTITVSLAADRPYICTPGNINFTATAIGTVSSYQFDFGDGSPVLTSATNVVAHNFTTPGNYTITVTATSPFGCTATTALPVQVRAPVVTGTVAPVNGCVPAIASFTATANLPTGSTVTSYNWNFNDGAPLTTATAGTTHTYNLPGTYTATVSIISSEGCTGSFTFPGIAYGTPPTGLVGYTPKPIICGSETATVIAKANTANSYLWDFGDGTTQTVTDTITTHKYASLGIKTVTVTPYFNGCAGAPTSFTVEVIGVIVGFNYANTCTNRNTYQFTNTSLGNVSTYIWNFGDASPDVFTPNTNHTYAVNGAYSTNLLIVDNVTGCRDSAAVNIYTARPTLTNPDSAICRYTPSTFTINNNYSNPANSYNWQVLGQTFVNVNTSVFIGNTLGNFTQNSVIINYGAQSCPDTISLNHPILVRGPNLDFTIPATVCVNGTIMITNNSAPFIASDTVSTWYWNYDVLPTNDTTYAPQTYSYGAPGSYQVKLVGIDKNGCKDSLSKTIVVNPLPYLRVVPQRDTLCAGQSSTLVAFHTGLLTWSNAVSLSCANCDTTIATPANTTNYVATATNSFGCISTDTARALVFSPFNSTIKASGTSVCNGDTLQLNASPPGKVIRWSPAIAISDTTIYNPIVQPPSTTTYTALLTDSAGCFSSSANITITIKSNPTVNAGPDIILPYAGTATITPLYSANTTSYLWTPATNLSCNNCPAPLVTALITQWYVIAVTSDSGCVARDSITIIVECKDANLYLPTAFSPNGDGRNDYFYPMTRGINSITKFVVYNRYGQTIFSRANFAPNIPSLGWSGKINNLPQDQTGYVYIMEAICDQGQKLVKKGSFVLIR